MSGYGGRGRGGEFFAPNGSGRGYGEGYAGRGGRSPPLLFNRFSCRCVDGDCCGDSLVVTGALSRSVGCEMLLQLHCSCELAAPDIF